MAYEKGKFATGEWEYCTGRAVKKIGRGVHLTFLDSMFRSLYMKMFEMVE